MCKTLHGTRDLGNIVSIVFNTHIRPTPSSMFCSKGQVAQSSKFREATRSTICIIIELI